MPSASYCGRASSSTPRLDRPAICSAANRCDPAPQNLGTGGARDRQPETRRPRQAINRHYINDPHRGLAVMSSDNPISCHCWSATPKHCKRAWANPAPRAQSKIPSDQLSDGRQGHRGGAGSRLRAYHDDGLIDPSLPRRVFAGWEGSGSGRFHEEILEAEK